MNTKYNEKYLSCNQTVEEFLIMKQQLKLLHDQYNNIPISFQIPIDTENNQYVQMFQEYEQPRKQVMKNLFNILLTNMMPPILRQRWYTLLITEEIKCDVQKFQTFLRLPGFKKFILNQQIDGLNLKDKSIDVEKEDSTSMDSSFSCQTNKDKSVLFCTYNQQIIFDIRRSFKQLNLFQEGQPLYENYCQCITILSMRHGRYIQGLASPCAVLLLSLPNCKDCCQLCFRVTQCRIYQTFMKLEGNDLNIYSNNIYKCVLKILELPQSRNKLELTRIELNNLNQKLNESLYQMMSGSLSGLILTCFSKISIDLSNYFFDLLSCTEDEDINILFIQLLCSFYLQKISIFLKYDLDTDWLLQEVTKQHNLEGDDFYQLQKIMKFVYEDQNATQLVKRCIQQSEIVIHQ